MGPDAQNAKVAIVIPAYNEQETVGDVVRRAREYSDLVIVVDDGSADGTAEAASSAGAIVLKHDRNRGKWAALRTGIEEALRRGADIVVTMDADGQHMPEEIPSLVFTLERADVAVGSRSRSGMPLIRKLSNTITTGLLRVMFGVKVADSQCGFRAYRRQAAEVLLSVQSDGFEGETESLVRLARAGMKLADAPVSTIYAGERSKIKASRDIYRFLKTVVKLRLRGV